MSIQFTVNNSEVEGQHNLQSVQPVRLLPSRVLLALLLSILTGFGFALFLLWNVNLRARFLYEEQDVSLSTHFIVRTLKEMFIVPKTTSEGGFRFRLLNYELNEGSYRPVEFPIKGLTIKQILDHKLSRSASLELFGNCALKIPYESAPSYFFTALTGPFNVLQYFAIAVWFGQGQTLFPIVLIVFTVASLIVNYCLYRRSRWLLQKLANIHQLVHLEDQELNGSELVPGDIIYIKRGQQMNCDCIILSGEIMVNEATLTGENIPVPKTQMGNEQFDIEKCNQNCLYEGTRIVIASNQAKAIVIRTGFQSLRGQYFRNVLFPAPQSKRFYIQASKFLVELACISVIAYLILLRYFIDVGLSTKLIVYILLNVIVWTIPPALPVFFQICKTVNLIRLGMKDILGSNVDKVEEAGRIDTICFDKTGTLTNLGLIAHTHNSIQNQEENVQNIMACCHHLVNVEGELAGDPLEVEMFKYTQWQITFENQKYFQVSNSKSQFEILVINEFSSSRQMMSVIAKSGSQHYVFAKGSAEQISLQSNGSSELMQKMSEYASKGLRVIALAYKEISNPNISKEEAEKGLNFVGLFVLENKLKVDTAAVINELKDANYAIKVISGDNPLTTIQCAKECGIVPANDRVQLLDFDGGQVLLDNQKSTQQIYDLLQEVLNSEHQLAITGKLLEYLSRFNSEIMLTQINNKVQVHQDTQVEIEDQKMNQLLLHIVQKAKVFARQKPEQKKQVVQILQQLKKQVMMVGDGANDCSAIAQAQIGISFSESDASYTAPFSSKSTSLLCVPIVLSAGKAAIQIIIEVFQYQLSVQISKVASVYIMSLCGQSFTDFQFTFLGYMSSLPFLLFLTFSPPATATTAFIPLDNQFAAQNQLAMFNQMICAILGQICNALIVVGLDIDLTPPRPIEEYNKKGMMGSVMFLGLIFYYMTMGISIYVSNPFKQRFYRNIPLLLWTITCSIITLVSIFLLKAGWLGVIDIRDSANGGHTGLNWEIFGVMVAFQALGFLGQTILQKILPSSYKLQASN